MMVSVRDVDNPKVRCPLPMRGRRDSYGLYAEVPRIVSQSLVHYPTIGPQQGGYNIWVSLRLVALPQKHLRNIPKCTYKRI